MKGFIVGYFEEWASDRNSIIIGYYTNWKKAIEVTKKLQQDNIKIYNKLRQVYMVEIEPNKTYDVKDSMDWIRNYPTNGRTQK